MSVLQTPHYEGLTVEKFVDQIEHNEDVQIYFPEKREEIERLPRSFIINVLYSLKGESFKRSVNQKMEERNRRLIEKQQIGLELDDEVKAAFLKSTQVSVSELLCAISC